jgi:tRNA (Thr-GGU) A37 N-methylase
MDEYTHVWVIYVFHANTNAGDTRNGGAVKAKVRVPRLDGKTVGALATRTPHRPLPIGLSLGRVVSVDARAGTLTLAGADLVDGTPVLDVKPYVPFCDRVEDAAAPAWVGKEAADRDEPLKITRVDEGERRRGRGRRRVRAGRRGSTPRCGWRGRRTREARWVRHRPGVSGGTAARTGTGGSTG